MSAVGNWIMDSGFRFAVAFFLGVVVFIAVVFVLVIGLSRHFGRINCEQFAQQTGRTTKFVVYNFANSGVCLTPTADGKWIPTSNLREFGDTP